MPAPVASSEPAPIAQRQRPGMTEPRKTVNVVCRPNRGTTHVAANRRKI
jgi:hypothetical protein